MIAASWQVKTRGIVTDARAPLPQAEDFAAALDWWREAGVDHDFVDDPTDWLTPPPSAPDKSVSALPVRRDPEPAVPAGKPAFGGDPAGWPADLESFRTWWLTDDALEDGGIGPRVAPRGPAQAAIMVVVAMPGEEDSDMLLSGAQGRLLNGFLRAAGIAEGSVYVASVLPRCAPMPDLAREGLGEIVRHHAALVAPKRIIALGRNILPLLAHETAQASATLPHFNHEGRNVPLMEARGPAELLRSARARAELWRSWLDWTYG